MNKIKFKILTIELNEVCTERKKNLKVMGDIVKDHKQLQGVVYLKIQITLFHV